MPFVQNWPITHGRFTSKVSGNPNIGAPVVGNQVIVTIKYEGAGTVSSVIDAYGNAYTKDGHGTANGNADNCEIWSCKSIATTGAAFTITVNLSALSFAEFGAMEWNGLAGTLSGTSTGTNGTNISGAPNVTLTTTDPLAVIVVVVAAEQLTAITAPSGFTAFDTSTNNGADMDGQAAYMSVTLLQSAVTYTWSGVTTPGSDPWVTCAVAYKIAVIAAGGSGMSGMSGMSGISGIF